MGLSIGIVGLPNVGKSTLFNALAKAHVPAEAYPFSTKDHHTGVAIVTDGRVERLAQIFRPERIVPAHVEFVDIAGLVEGASKGEGLGNKFLSYIREVDAIIHVVRCFENPDVAHVAGSVDPVPDIEIVNTELGLADLSTLEKRLSGLRGDLKRGAKEVHHEIELVEKAMAHLNRGEAITEMLPPDLFLLSTRPVLFVGNVSERDTRFDSAACLKLKNFAQKHNISYLFLCAKLEAELTELSPDEEKEFLESLGMKEPGTQGLLRESLRLLDLIAFFTKDGPEVRAWPIPAGTKAPQGAGKIHSDFERGFIRAEVYSYNDLISLGSEHAVKEKGKLRLEGHDYVIQDGDIIHFRFSV